MLPVPMQRAAPLPVARRLLQIGVGVALAAAGIAIGDRYIRRLPHHEGYFMIAVADAVTRPPPRPRHTVIVVVDGLGLEFARPLGSVARLAAHGQCRVTDVGPISVSRPVYAVLSTGLEQDRTGARNNDQSAPLAAESFWQVAREAGLEVSAVTDMQWWQQLFPAGFDRYTALPEDQDYFATGPLGDLRLVHPVYIDHAGHAAGSASPEYAAAVARVDGELAGLLDRLDLAQDLVVFTADHGHSATGGHGGPTPEISRVLTCFAGRGVVRDPAAVEAAPMRAHGFAGAVSLLLGLRFPRHMRAGDDDLDVALTLADPALYPADYLADRRAAIDRFRAANAGQIAAWLGRPGEWKDLYAAERRRQLLRAAGVALVVIAGFVGAARRRRLGVGAALGLLGWCVAVMLATAALHVLVLGGLDWTAINRREHYLVRAPLICLAPAVLAIAARAWRSRGDMARVIADQMTLAVLALAIDLGHIVVYGWPLGFPLPGPTLLLLPFLASFFLVVHALLAALLAAAALLRGLLARR
jgi:hypothetical protein